MTPEQEIAYLQKENNRLKAALEECIEYFENRCDVVDGSYGESAPNEEMSMLSNIKYALGEIP